MALVAGSPNCSDLDRGRRSGTRADFQELVKLGQAFNILHVSGGYPVEPTDIHASVRHLLATRSLLTLTDKVPHAYSLGAQRNIGLKRVRTLLEELHHLLSARARVEHNAVSAVVDLAAQDSSDDTGLIDGRGDDAYARDDAALG